MLIFDFSLRESICGSIVCCDVTMLFWPTRTLNGTEHQSTDSGQYGKWCYVFIVEFVSQRSPVVIGM
jgi:hypothetical protein